MIKQLSSFLCLLFVTERADDEIDNLIIWAIFDIKRVERKIIENLIDHISSIF